MDQKTILITGASSGIGKACAELLAKNGNQLVLVARNQEKLESLKDSLPGTHLVVSYDLQDLENIKSIMDTVRNAGWKLDGMVYSAGVDATCPVKVNSIPLMVQAMTVNCFAFYELGKWFFSAKYSNTNASVVALSSVAAILCQKGQGPYSASKAALNSVVKTMSREFVKRKIRVNAVLPAGVSTPMAEEKSILLAGVTDADEDKRAESLGIITPQSVAESVEFLLSDKSLYITGELLKMDAGYQW